MSEEVFGLDTGPLEAARIMALFVRKDWVEMETALYGAKWFDYRFMNPVAATYLYAHEFVRFYRQAWMDNYSTKRGQFVKVFDPKDLFSLPSNDTISQRQLTGRIRRDGTALKKRSVDQVIQAKKRLISGIWRGRMFADAMGMPYSDYLEFGFYWAMRYWKQPEPPRPTQLYSDLLIEKVPSSWYERHSTTMFYSKLPQYSNATYETMLSRLRNEGASEAVLAPQNAHHEWLLGQLELRHNDPEVAARLIWEAQVLPADKVRTRFGEDQFERVLRFSDRYSMTA